MCLAWFLSSKRQKSQKDPANFSFLTKNWFEKTFQFIKQLFVIFKVLKKLKVKNLIEKES